MVAAAPKEAKAVKAKPKPAAKKSSPSSHPPFLEMITDAIVTLKERTGSSQYAIQKFIEEKHKDLPSTFRKLLLFQLKRLVASGKVVKVKNSFKLSTTAKPAAAPAKKPAAEKPKPKPKATAAKPKPAAATAKPKTAAKPKSAAKPKPASTAAAKRKAEEKPKPKAAAKPAKVAKTAAKASPGKKAVKPKKATAAAAKLKTKKVAAVKAAKKPRSVKSPARKAKK